MSVLRQLTVLTTNKCTASCSHCIMNSSPHRREKLSFKTISETIQKLLLREKKLDLIIFAGGEPTLLGEELLDSISFCSELGLKTRLVTNAFWAKNSLKAEENIDLFRQSGLMEINFSLDDYHLPFVKLDSIIHAWHASKNKGFTSVVIANCYGPRSLLKVDDICNFLGEEVCIFWDCNGKPVNNVNPSDDGTTYLISNSYLQRMGRGRGIEDTHVNFPQKQSDLKIPCPWAVTK